MYIIKHNTLYSMIYIKVNVVSNKSGKDFISHISVDLPILMGGLHSIQRPTLT